MVKKAAVDSTKEQVEVLKEAGYFRKDKDGDKARDKDWEKEFDKKFNMKIGNNNLVLWTTCQALKKFIRSLLSAQRKEAHERGILEGIDIADENYKKNIIPSIREKLIEEVEVAHKTKDGYCCACEYDLACFEDKLFVQRKELKKEIKEAGISGYQEGRECVLSWLLEELDFAEQTKELADDPTDPKIRLKYLKMKALSFPTEINYKLQELKVKKGE